MKNESKKHRTLIERIESAGMAHPHEWMPYPYLFSETKTAANYAEFDRALDDLMASGRFEKQDHKYGPEYRINQ